jgi:hypothetical protein
MTKGVLITIPGGAEAALAEITELGFKGVVGGTSWCTVELEKTAPQLLHERSQTALRILQLLGQGDRAVIEKCIRALKPTTESFCLRASGPDRQELEEDLGGLIHDTTGAPVNLSKPIVQYYLYETEGEYLFGIDLFGDLSKRHYKIISGAHSLTGPFAACALRVAGWTPKQDLVIWPCMTGELAIEAALWASKKSPRAYQLQALDDSQPKKAIVAADPKLAMVRSTEKNAKVAGVAQHIRFSRQDADWLDTKYDEHEVPYLIGLLPNLAVYKGMAKEIFYQLDFILKRNGTAAFLCVNDASASALEAAGNEYELTRQYLWSGKHTYTLLLCRRRKKQK